MPNLEGSFQGDFRYFVLFAEGSYGRFWNGKEKFLFIVPVGVTTFTPPLIQEDLIQFKTAGYATSTSGGCGFPIPIIDGQSIRLSIIPTAGYCYDYVRMKQMNTNPSPLIDFNETGALYHTIFDFSQRKFDLVFEGPFTVGDLEFKVSNFWMKGGYTYHWTRLKQNSAFDLFSFDPSIGIALESIATLFAQTKKTRGHFAHGTLGWQILENFYIAADGTYMNLKTRKKQSLDARQVLETQVPFPPFNIIQSRLIQDPFELEWTFFTVVFEMGFSI